MYKLWEIVCRVWTTMTDILVSRTLELNHDHAQTGIPLCYENAD